MHEFIEITEMAEKFYVKKWGSLPPGTISYKIPLAIDAGIPIEYLVGVGIISPSNVGTFDTDEETHEKIVDYMMHTGKIKSEEDVNSNQTTSGQEVKKEIVKTEKKTNIDNEDVKLTIRLLEDEIKQLRGSLDQALKDKEQIEVSKTRENDKLLKEIKQHIESIDLLHEELDKSQEGSVSSEDIETAKRERMKFRSDLEEMSSKVTDLNEEVISLTSDIRSEKDKVFELEMSVDSANRSLDLKSKELQRKQDELQEVKSKLLDASTKLSVSEEKNITLSIQIDNLKDNASNEIYISEISKLNKEIENLKVIIGEKIVEIDEKQYQIEAAERKLIDTEVEHASIVNALRDSHTLKLEEYRRMLSENETTIVTAEITTDETSVDITRARLEGKKIISILGNSPIDIIGNIEEHAQIFVDYNIEDADYHILVTDLTKHSIEEFKKNYRKHKNSLKIMVNWMEGLPFSMRSLTGTEMDIVINNTTYEFKESWVNDSAQESWKQELNMRLRNALGVY